MEEIPRRNDIPYQAAAEWFIFYYCKDFQLLNLSLSAYILSGSRIESPLRLRDWLSSLENLSSKPRGNVSIWQGTAKTEPPQQNANKCCFSKFKWFLICTSPKIFLKLVYKSILKSIWIFLFNLSYFEFRNKRPQKV